MKKVQFFKIAIFVLISFGIASAKWLPLDPELFPTNIPEGVRYSPPPIDECRSAKHLLKKAFEADRDINVGLFKDLVLVCSAMWSSLKKVEPFKSDEGAVFFGKAKDIILEGKAFKSPESLAALEKLLREKLRNEGTITIRPPNYEELNKYWAVIAWDLEFPLFVVVSNKSEYIFQFDDGHVGNIVDLNSFSFISNP